MSDHDDTLTRLLGAWAGGDPNALEQLTPLVYQELRRLAAGYMKGERPEHTLQPTALVHEAYLRLVEQRHQNWESRRHFFGVAAHLMRLILVDSARRSHAAKRGGGTHQITLDDLENLGLQRPDTFIALDDALTELAAMDSRKAKIIELRYFGGMTLEETANTLGTSTATVERDTRVAHMWLCRYMKGADQHDS
jgi:RNA polymerase sigma factor (TIGR02999 family)